MKIELLRACVIAIISLSLSAQAQSQYDSGDPTPAEQHVLEVINRARANPTAEGQRLGIDINEGLSTNAVPRPPLAMNKILLGTARAHSQDMYTRKFFEHTNPSGLDPFERMTMAGYHWNSAGENIAAGSNHSAFQLEDILMIDHNYPGRGHRVNLLDVGSGSVFREIGVGYYSGPTPITGSSQPGVNGLKDFITEDFGTTSTGPFLLGVVYNDTNHNNFYDIGEGISGVTITPSAGSFFAVTGTAGGFAMPIGTSGTITVTASGGGITTTTMQVSLTGSNVKVDFNASAVPTPPSITSPLSATGMQFENFTYTATATGTQPITFMASGLPMGLTLNGSTISGQPQVSGQFMVTLTAQNSEGSDQKTLVIDISPAPVSNTLTDTDSDGFPDEIEMAAGTSPTNVNDTPFGGQPAVPEVLTFPKHPIIKLNFAIAGRDSITGSGTLPIPAGFSIAGKTAILDVGGVIRTFTFDAHGKGLSGKDILKITIKAPRGVVADQIAPFKITITKATAAALLEDEGLVNATVTKNVSVPFVLLFNQHYYTSTQTLLYKAKLNKTALAK